MKTSELKQIIKEAVKESIQEELKTILLEALKSQPTKQPIQESRKMTFTTEDITPKPSPMGSRENFMSLIKETANPQGIGQPYDPNHPTATGDDLPPGEVSFDQIMNLMSK
jgi:hypothetical protein